MNICQPVKKDCGGASAASFCRLVPSRPVNHLAELHMHVPTRGFHTFLLYVRGGGDLCSKFLLFRRIDVYIHPF